MSLNMQLNLSETRVAHLAKAGIRNIIISQGRKDADRKLFSKMASGVIIIAINQREAGMGLGSPWRSF